MNTLSDMPLLAHAAFLLDLDGTLLDIAPTPDQVVVPKDLPGNLRKLRALCGDALAIITGRPTAQVDALLGDVPFAVAGEHGTSIRHAPGQPVRCPPMPGLPSHWRTAASVLAGQHPGSLLESKSHGLVLHYRAVPEAGQALHDGLLPLLAEQPGAYVLMPAKMAWEIRPAGADKGTAVSSLMRQPPFAGRMPVFVGDDVTDEDGMRAARQAGGIGLRVPEAFGDAAGVRAWLAALVSNAAAASQSLNATLRDEPATHPHPAASTQDHPT